MLADYSLLLIGAILVNNFVFGTVSRFVPFYGGIQQTGNRHWYVERDDFCAHTRVYRKLAYL